MNKFHQNNKQQSYLPYIMNTVSTTSQQTGNHSEGTTTSTHTPPRQFTNKYHQQHVTSSKIFNALKPKSNNLYSTSRPSPILQKQEKHYLPTNHSQRYQQQLIKPYSS